LRLVTRTRALAVPIRLIHDRSIDNYPERQVSELAA
jgi:hypothetical protein